MPHEVSRFAPGRLPPPPTPPELLRLLPCWATLPSPAGAAPTGGRGWAALPPDRLPGGGAVPAPGGAGARRAPASKGGASDALLCTLYTVRILYILCILTVYCILYTLYTILYSVLLLYMLY